MSKRKSVAGTLKRKNPIDALIPQQTATPPLKPKTAAKPASTDKGKRVALSAHVYLYQDAWLRDVVGQIQAAEGNRKLKKVSVIRALIDAVRTLDIEVGGVQSEEELTQIFLDAFGHSK